VLPKTYEFANHPLWVFDSHPLCVEGALDHHHAALLDMLYRYEIGIYTSKPSRYGGGGNGYWHEPIDSIIIMRVNLEE
jgi:hypothetical protein